MELTDVGVGSGGRSAALMRGQLQRSAGVPCDVAVGESHGRTGTIGYLRTPTRATGREPGNLRVVGDLVAAGYSRTPTGSVRDVADHALVNSSVWYAEVAAPLVVAAWRRRRHIGNRATIGAVAVQCGFAARARQAKRRRS